MPRGKRKNGQFAFKIWVPDGPILEWYSTQDLTPAEWSDSVRKWTNELLRIAERVEAKTK